jgi:hypothetical protein
MVAGDQLLADRMLPGTFSSLNVLTIWVSDIPSAYDVKIRRMTAASLGSISILQPSGRGRPFLSIFISPTGTER